MTPTSQRRQAGHEPADVIVFDAAAAARTLIKLVEERRQQIADLLQIDADTPEGAKQLRRFITVALDVVTGDRSLLEADAGSVISAIRKAAELGLEPSGVLGDGVIIARRDRDQGGRKIARFEPMYRGLAKVARRSPDVAKLDWQIVYEADEFRYAPLESPPITHVRETTNDPGAIRGAYCVIVLTNGEWIPTYLTTAQILKVRDLASRSWQADGDRSLWAKWPEEMMLKTAVKRAMKKAPLDSRAQRALAYDDEIETPVRVTPPARPAALGLRGRLGLAPVVEALQQAPDAETSEESTPDPTAALGPSDGLLEGLDEEVDADPTDH